jgi:putative glycosyltransferase (TIGR04348 family)
VPHPIVEIYTPYAAQANNGNWRTAARWARHLRSRYRVIVQTGPESGSHRADCLIALHARRSFPAVQDWRERCPAKPLVVTLTGTDLYRDLPESAEARTSLRAADRLIVLQEDALRFLPQAERAKAHVIYQSAVSLRSCEKPRTRLNCILVAHLRSEKDPLTAMSAWDFLERDEPIYLTQVGAALDKGLAEAALDLQRREARYRWVGPKPHAWTRQAIKHAHLLIVPSKMEGGANVIVEALTAGTPVVASRVSGNIGMLGEKFTDYFEVGDSEMLAGMLKRYWQEPDSYRDLSRQCRARRALFQPEREQAALFRLIGQLL